MRPAGWSTTLAYRARRWRVRATLAVGWLTERCDALCDRLAVGLIWVEAPAVTRIDGDVGILRTVPPPSNGRVARRNDLLAIRAIAEHRAPPCPWAVETVLLEFLDRKVGLSYAEAARIARRVLAGQAYQPAPRTSRRSSDGVADPRD